MGMLCSRGDYERIPTTPQEYETNEGNKPSTPYKDGSTSSTGDSEMVLRRSIYSAGHLRHVYMLPVFATFLVQLFVLFINSDADNMTFYSSIGRTEGSSHYKIFSRALARFICFMLILIKCHGDVQNAIDIYFTSCRLHSYICALLPFLIALILPLAFVYTISTNTNEVEDITRIGLLSLFIDMDTNVYDLILMANDVAEPVRSLKMVVPSTSINTRYWFITIFIPIYMLAFFFLLWIAALEMYPLAFLLMALTMVIYLSPYIDDRELENDKTSYQQFIKVKV